MTIEYISYSQYNTYTRCPRSWYLGKVKQAEERQTWFLPIGTAVHTMIENHLKPRHQLDPLPSAEDVFYPLIEKQMLIEPDTSKWLAGGSKDDPVIEDKALEKVKVCFERALEILEDWDIWEIEYDASGNLPGLDVPVRAFVDILGEYRGKKNKKARGPGILDWKTGSSKPKDNFQLDTYVALTSMREGHQPIKWGWWGMLDPAASVARPVDLSAVDAAEVGAKYQKVVNSMNAKLYKTDASKWKCDFCFMQDNCKLRSGENDRTSYYDKADTDGYPF